VKASIAALVLSLASGTAIAGESPVLFQLTVQKDGRVLYSPKVLAAVGETATVRLSDGLSFAVLAKPFDADGRAWSQVRITFFETDDSKMVQEMSMRHKFGFRTGSFEYTDPTNRRFVVRVGSDNQ
jgi:hypothetical protein